MDATTINAEHGTKSNMSTDGPWCMAPTHYQVLGVDQDATPAQIDLAASQLLARCAGWKGRLGMVLMFGSVPDIGLSYAILRDADARARYDAQLRRTSMVMEYLPPTW
mgnify:CR=1 FL=1